MDASDLPFSDSVDALRMGIFFFAMIVAAYTDLMKRTISDRITLWGSAVGVLLFALTQGGFGLMSSLLGWALGFFPFYLLFRMGGLGLGDAKLMGLVGALGGPKFVILSFWYTGVIGFILALAVLIQKKQLLSGMKRVWLLCLQCVGLGKTSETLDPLESLTIPYGVAIVFGSYLAFFKLVG